jgi:hypothetical protein
MRCEKAGTPTKKVNKSGKEFETGFRENVAALISINVIPASHAPRWEALRGLRNDASRPKRRSIYDPGQASSMLGLVAEKLNEMF